LEAKANWEYVHVRQIKSVVNSLVNFFGSAGYDETQASKAEWPKWHSLIDQIHRSKKKRTHQPKKAKLIDLKSLAEAYTKFDPRSLLHLRYMVVLSVLTDKGKRPSDVCKILSNEDSIKIVDGDVRSALLGISFFQRKILIAIRGLKNVDYHSMEGIPCICHKPGCAAVLKEDHTPVSNHDCDNCKKSPCRFEEWLKPILPTVNPNDKFVHLFKMCGFGMWMQYLSYLPRDKAANTKDPDLPVIRALISGSKRLADRGLKVESVGRCISAVGELFDIDVLKKCTGKSGRVTYCTAARHLFGMSREDIVDVNSTFHTQPKTQWKNFEMMLFRIEEPRAMFSQFIVISKFFLSCQEMDRSHRASI
jgi:hypothetical protein